MALRRNRQLTPEGTGNNQDNTQHRKAGANADRRGGTRRRLRRFSRLTRKQKKRRLRIGLAALVAMLALAVLVIYRDYNERPGLLERSTLKATDLGTDSITLQWREARNTDSYTIYYKPEGEPPLGWRKVTVESSRKGDAGGSGKASVELKNLQEGTKYGIIIRADNSERSGFSTREKFFSTLRTQKIDGRKHFTKLTVSRDFALGMKAKTDLSYESEDESIVRVSSDGKASIKGAGTVRIKVTAAETKEYEGAEFETEIEVIDTYAVSAGGASAHVIYSLDSNNCEVVKSVTGAGSATVPQSFDFTGDKYIVAYGMEGSQRIVTFDAEGDGKSVSVPQIALGHPNGFCYDASSKTCYCVRGWSGRAVTYKPETGEYGTVTFPYGASGIGYDRKEDLIYTASRTAMIAYSIGENGYSIEHRCGVVKHSGQTYTQDCGGHAGIMMRCLSGSSKHGTNYVDLYDMKHGEYLGSFACDLSEVESASVDNDGYMLLLANTSGGTDYIWKTPINIEDIGDGLR